VKAIRGLGGTGKIGGILYQKTSWTQESWRNTTTDEGRFGSSYWEKSATVLRIAKETYVTNPRGMELRKKRGRHYVGENRSRWRSERKGSSVKLVGKENERRSGSREGEGGVQVFSAGKRSFAAPSRGKAVLAGEGLPGGGKGPVHFRQEKEKKTPLAQEEMGGLEGRGGLF